MFQYALHPPYNAPNSTIKVNGMSNNDISEWLKTWTSMLVPLAWMVVGTSTGNLNCSGADVQDYMRSKVICLDLKPSTLPSSSATATGWRLSRAIAKNRNECIAPTSSTAQEAAVYLDLRFTDKDDNCMEACISVDNTAKNALTKLREDFDKARRIVFLCIQDTLELLEEQDKPGVLRFGRVCTIKTNDGQYMNVRAKRIVK